MGFTGHAHAHTQRISIWKRAGAQRTLLYETYNWEEPLTVQFESQHKYGNPSYKSGADGALSGVLSVNRGDTVEWECHVVNNSAATLRFGDQAFTGEMCNVFGFYAPGFLNGPWRCGLP